jgi:putative CocE/NonD family hydrolase
MPDGAVLLADRWYPLGPVGATAPVVLLRSPYGRRQIGICGRLFAERGYQVVIQSCRGTFGSQGDWVPFRNEQSDGRATLEWISAQPWFTGTLATFGPSYLGLTQTAVFRDPPPYLRASALDVTSSNFRDDVIYPSGILALGQMLPWIRQLEHQELSPLAKLRTRPGEKSLMASAYRVLPVADADVAAVGHHVSFFQDWIEHDRPGDSWWEPVDFGADLATAPPSSLVGGWYDLFLPGQVADFVALRAAGRTARLTIGPWAHVSPGGIATFMRDGLEWFDVHLRGSPEDARSSVRLYVMGARRWVEFADWPPGSDQETWHLHAEGRLDPSPPAASSPDRFTYDPADPTPSVGGPSLDGATAGAKDQRQLESRGDVLTYTSAVLTRDLTVIGPLRARIYCRSSLEHSDVFVKLCDVSPRGRSKNLSDGIVRAIPGVPPRSPDGSFCVEVSMWPTANTFKRGHRIRLQVSGGAHPLFARNAGTGERAGTATRLCVADQEIFHDPEHPSSVVLPVMSV